MNTSVREKSNESGLALKKKVIKKLFELYLELKKPIEDDAITKMFLDTTNGKKVKDVANKLTLDDKDQYDLLQGLISKETDYQFKDLFKIKLSDFINRFIGIDVKQESITKMCKDVAEEYSELKAKKVGQKNKLKEFTDAFNYCLVNTNHMLVHEIKEYKMAFDEINIERVKNLQSKLKSSFYLPHWVNVALKLPKETLNWNRGMLGKINLKNQMEFFIVKYNKKTDSIQGYYDFLEQLNPLQNAGYYHYKKKKNIKKIKKKSSKKRKKNRRYTKKRKNKS